MNKIWIIAKRELNVFFDSLIAYLIIVLFLGFTGLFTWLIGTNVFAEGQASMQSFFGIAYWTLFFFIPAITMRMIAEEKKSGTIELLLTKPVTDRQVILGKFLSGLILIAITLAFTLPYYFTIASLGEIDHGAVWCGYLGLLLMSAAYLGIGLFTSSVSNNQIVALLLALIIGVFFHFVFGYVAGGLKGTTGEIINYMSVSAHFESISRGVIDTKDVIYFLSLTLLGLFATEATMARRHISD
jgi:ABC-2 type transport system permease protein